MLVTVPGTDVPFPPEAARLVSGISGKPSGRPYESRTETVARNLPERGMVSLDAPEANLEFTGVV